MKSILRRNQLSFLLGPAMLLSTASPVNVASADARMLAAVNESFGLLASRTLHATEGGHASGRCLSASRQALYMAIENRCSERIEVAFCYHQHDQLLDCDRQKFGMVGVNPSDSSGIPLPDTNGSGEIAMIGCIAPTYPAHTSYDGAVIQADCF